MANIDDICPDHLMPIRVTKGIAIPEEHLLFSVTGFTNIIFKEYDPSIECSEEEYRQAILIVKYNISTRSLVSVIIVDYHNEPDHLYMYKDEGFYLVDTESGMNAVFEMRDSIVENEIYASYLASIGWEILVFDPLDYDQVARRAYRVLDVKGSKPLSDGFIITFHNSRAEIRVSNEQLERGGIEDWEEFDTFLVKCRGGWSDQELWKAGSILDIRIVT